MVTNHKLTSDSLKSVEGPSRILGIVLLLGMIISLIIPGLIFHLNAIILSVVDLVIIFIWYLLIRYFFREKRQEVKLFFTYIRYTNNKYFEVLFEYRKPRPLGVVRANWICLKETDRRFGVLEYSSLCQRVRFF